MTDCVTDSVAVYQPTTDKPWNKRRVQHLYNRMGVGASLPDIQWALSLSPEQVIDALIDNSMNEPTPTKADYPFGDTIHDPWQFSYQASDDDGNLLYIVDDNGNPILNDEGEMQPVLIWPNAINAGAMVNHFLVNLIENNGLKYKLLLFWSNHFVIEATNLLQYYANWLYYYVTHLHNHGFGNFLEMTKAIGLTPSMLVYLNGNRSTKIAPNENYARELLELFTMGPDNYSQTDVEEIARIFTGWRAEGIPYGDNQNSGFPDNPNPWFPNEINAHLFRESDHDWGEKIVFGKSHTPGEETKSAAWQEYLWLHHTVIFEERKDEIANFICSKLYRYFIYDEAVNEAVVAELATTFKENDWQIAPVLRQLFKSEHFFDEKIIGSGIKSPVDFLCGFLRQADFKVDEDYFREGPPTNSFFTYQFHTVRNYDLPTLGQRIFSPVNVAGWPGGKTWITENTLTSRWSALTTKLNAFAWQQSGQPTFPDTFEKFRQLAKDLTQEYSSDADFNNPEVIVTAIAEHFIITDLLPETTAAAVEKFKGEIPNYYYDNGNWNLDTDYNFPNESVPRQVINLLIYLTELPEYQLN